MNDKNNAVVIRIGEYEAGGYIDAESFMASSPLRRRWLLDVAYAAAVRELVNQGLLEEEMPEERQ